MWLWLYYAHHISTYTIMNSVVSVYLPMLHLYPPLQVQFGKLIVQKTILFTRDLFCIKHKTIMVIDYVILTSSYLVSSTLINIYHQQENNSLMVIQFFYHKTITFNSWTVTSLLLCTYGQLLSWQPCRSCLAFNL